MKVLALLIVLFVQLPGAALAAPLLIFAAASLQGPLDEIAALYEADSGQEITVSYAASSALARQIQRGAPASVFLSAHPDWAATLAPLAISAPVTFATNHLVLIGHEPRPDTALSDLPAVLGKDRLAVAQTEAVPAGVYAREALQNAGVWSHVKPRLVEAANVRAALVLVARGDVRFGIVYATDAATSDVAVLHRIDKDSHSPITYAAVPLSEKGGVSFVAFLQSEAAQTVLRAHGYGTP